MYRMVDKNLTTRSLQEPANPVFPKSDSAVFANSVLLVTDKKNWLYTGATLSQYINVTHFPGWLYPWFLEKVIKAVGYGYFFNQG